MSFFKPRSAERVLGKECGSVHFACFPGGLSDFEIYLLQKNDRCFQIEFQMFHKVLKGDIYMQ